MRDLRAPGRAAWLLSACAALPGASVAAPPAEGSIPFANHHGIFDWQADGSKGIWIQGNDRRWFYGSFMGPCHGLDFADSVGFVTEPSGAFNRWSYIVVRHEMPCHFTSFIPSSGPPPSRKVKDATKIAPAGAPAGPGTAPGATQPPH